MTFTKTSPFVAFALLTTAAPLFADEVAPTIVTSGDTTVVYVFPTSPQTFVPVSGLPSFLAMPGAPLPSVATQVVYSAPLPAPMVATSAADLDCENFKGEVTLAGADVFGLDDDGDGIGCEPEER